MNRNSYRSLLGSFKHQAFGVVLLFGCISCTGAVNAAALPKGNCADPKPYTDLRHCVYEKADLRGKNLQGADLRGVSLYMTQLQGANLTNALVGGDAIVHAQLEGVVGLPSAALAILKTSYLVSRERGKVSLSRLRQSYKGDNENVAGLDNIDLVKEVEGDSNTIALLSFPRYGASSTTIFARFKDNNFDFPACYGSIDLMNDGNAYYFAHWGSLRAIRRLAGSYLIGALASGTDGDVLGISEWRKVVLLEMTPKCEMTLLHEVFVERGGDYENRNGEDVAVWCGGELDYRLIDEQTAEIKITTPVSSKVVCGSNANPQEKVIVKTIKTNKLRKP